MKGLNVVALGQRRALSVDGPMAAWSLSLVSWSAHHIENGRVVPVDCLRPSIASIQSATSGDSVTADAVSVSVTAYIALSSYIILSYLLYCICYFCRSGAIRTSISDDQLLVHSKSSDNSRRRDQSG